MADPNTGGAPRAPSDEELATHVPQARAGREARLGIFVIFGLISFITVLFLLTDPATLRGRYMLHTIVNDAGGVRRGDPIQMRGVNIGRIHSFEMRREIEDVVITLEVEGEWQVPTQARTRLGAAGVFGGRVVEVLPGDATTFHQAGDTIPGEGGSAGGILGSMDDISGQAEDVMTQIQALLDAETISSVQGSARELEGLLSQMSGLVSEQRGALADLTQSLRRSAEGIEGAAEAGPDIRSAIARADSVMAVLNEASGQIDGTVATLRSILDKVDRGEGTLGRLVHDPALYDNLNSASERFAALIADFQANPKKYINISIF